MNGTHNGKQEQRNAGDVNGECDQQYNGDTAATGLTHQSFLQHTAANYRKDREQREEDIVTHDTDDGINVVGDRKQSQYDASQIDEAQRTPDGDRPILEAVGTVDVPHKDAAHASGCQPCHQPHQHQKDAGQDRDEHIEQDGGSRLNVDTTQKEDVGSLLQKSGHLSDETVLHFGVQLLEDSNRKRTGTHPQP